MNDAADEARRNNKRVQLTHGFECSSDGPSRHFACAQQSGRFFRVTLAASWVNGEPRSRACTTGFGRMVERAGEAAGLDFKAHPHMLRHSFVANKGHDTRALQAQEHPAHGALYRLGAGPFQGLLALTPRPSASEVLRLLSSSRSGRRRECIG